MICGLYDGCTGVPIATSVGGFVATGRGNAHVIKIIQCYKSRVMTGLFHVILFMGFFLIYPTRLTGITACIGTWDYKE